MELQGQILAFKPAIKSIAAVLLSIYAAADVDENNDKRF